MAFTEDLSIFFDTDDFAVNATFTKSDNSTVSKNIIFDNGTNQEVMYDAQIEANTPSAMIKTSDLTGIVRGNNVSINAVNYKIERLEKLEDGAITRIYLK